MTPNAMPVSRQELKVSRMVASMAATIVPNGAIRSATNSPRSWLSPPNSRKYPLGRAIGLVFKSAASIFKASSGNTPRLRNPCTLLSRSPFLRAMGLSSGMSPTLPNALRGTAGTKVSLPRRCTGMRILARSSVLSHSSRFRIARTGSRSVPSSNSPPTRPFKALSIPRATSALLSPVRFNADSSRSKTTLGGAGAIETLVCVISGRAAMRRRNCSPSSFRISVLGPYSRTSSGASTGGPWSIPRTRICACGYSRSISICSRRISASVWFSSVVKTSARDQLGTPFTLARRL